MMTSKKTFLLFIGLAISISKPTTACTTIHTLVDPFSESPDANFTVIARSMELGVRALMPFWDVVVTPRESKDFQNFFRFLTPKSDYPPFHINPCGFVSINVPISRSEGVGLANVVLEGMNEHGVTLSAQTLSMSVYQTLEHGPEKEQLSWIDFIPYILGNFKNARNAVRALQNDVIVIETDFLKKHPGLGQHWTLADAHGNHFVIEYIDGILNVHENTVGVMTNDPNFSWHVQNLDNYVNVQSAIPTAQKSIQVDQPSNLHPKPFLPKVPSTTSHGGGLLGLPGDLSPPARFVRSFYLRSLANAVNPPGNLSEALALATNLIDAVAIPYGAVSPPSSGKTDPIFTLPELLRDNELQQWAVLKVPRKGLLFYRDYVHSTWKKINMDSINFSPGSPPASSKLFNPNESFAVNSPLSQGNIPRLECQEA